jgi:hypothetical protein
MLEPPPPLGSLQPNVPEELERIVARCLDRYPDRRFPDVLVLAEQLQKFAGPSSAVIPLRRSAVDVAQSMAVQRRALTNTMPSKPRVRKIDSEDTTLREERDAGPATKRRAAWRLAVLAGACVTIAALALFLRGPSKRVNPQPATVVPQLSLARIAQEPTVTPVFRESAAPEAAPAVHSAESSGAQNTPRIRHANSHTLQADYAGGKPRVVSSSIRKRAIPNQVSSAPPPAASGAASDTVVPNFGGRR